MLGWLIGKGIDKKLTEFHSTIKSSFLNIREDMNLISNWVTHFNEKHNTHDLNISKHTHQIQALHIKLIQLEDLLAIKSATNLVGSPNEDETNSKSESLLEESNNKSKLFGESVSKELYLSLPEAQRKVLNNMANHDRLNMGEWISLKKIAMDYWPTLKYSDSRSSIAQLINILETQGLVDKKIVNRRAFARLKSEVKTLLYSTSDPNLSVTGEGKRKPQSKK